jgi:proteic killer suppression protein
MIQKRRDQELQGQARRGHPCWPITGKGFPANLIAVARRKLVMLDDAETLNDLRMVPGNRLEALKGGRAGQHSIRINDQHRVCFVWTGSGAEGVEITDYH